MAKRQRRVLFQAGRPRVTAAFVFLSVIPAGDLLLLLLIPALHQQEPALAGGSNETQLRQRTQRST